jgi:hypothetical protein
MGGAYSKHDINGTCFVEKPEERGPLGRPRLVWEYNIKMDLREISLEGVDTSGARQGPMAGPCEHSNGHLGSIKRGKFFD